MEARRLKKKRGFSVMVDSNVMHRSRSFFSFSFSFFFCMDDLKLVDVALTLDADININVSYATHVANDKLLTLTAK
jgi:hypothetical protein